MREMSIWKCRKKLTKNNGKCLIGDEGLYREEDWEDEEVDQGFA